MCWVRSRHQSVRRSTGASRCRKQPSRKTPIHPRRCVRAGIPGRAQCGATAEEWREPRAAPDRSTCPARPPCRTASSTRTDCRRPRTIPQTGYRLGATGRPSCRAGRGLSPASSVRISQQVGSALPSVDKAPRRVTAWSTWRSVLQRWWDRGKMNRTHP